nr:sugar phosphate isomerase/epimerase [Dermabacter hominis]
MFPLGLEDTFKAARETGYDGVEVMCSLDPATRDAMRLETLTRVYDLPILSLHAPTLFFLQFAGGLDPKKKLEDTMRLAVDLGVPTVVAHPPFRWQGRYAKNFVEIVAELEERYGIALAVENMYPWRLGVREALPYYPDHDPTDEDYAHLTIDLSHASTAGDDALAMIERVGDRLSHLHLTDGSGHTLRDEHLVPGEGDQPVAEILQRLARRGWGGSVIVEIATGTSRNFDAKLAPIERSLVVARRELSHV